MLTSTPAGKLPRASATACPTAGPRDWHKGRKAAPQTEPGPAGSGLCLLVCKTGSQACRPPHLRRCGCSFGSSRTSRRGHSEVGVGRQPSLADPALLWVPPDPPHSSRSCWTPHLHWPTSSCRLDSDWAPGMMLAPRGSCRRGVLGLCTLTEIGDCALLPPVTNEGLAQCQLCRGAVNVC